VGSGGVKLTDMVVTLAPVAMTSGGGGTEIINIRDVTLSEEGNQ
jgi:hypothetical protein